MAILSVIRRWHVRDGMSIREIARRTGLSRNTVRKYLANQVIEPVYPPRESATNLDDYEETLTNWLFRESRRHRKQRKTVKQLHRDLMTLGFDWGEDWIPIDGVSTKLQIAHAKLCYSRAFFLRAYLT